jgi:hypothetical protein
MTSNTTASSFIDGLSTTTSVLQITVRRATITSLHRGGSCLTEDFCSDSILIPIDPIARALVCVRPECPLVILHHIEYRRSSVFLPLVSSFLSPRC